MEQSNEKVSPPPNTSLELRLARIEQSLERVEHMFSQLTEQKDAMLGLAGDVLDRGNSSPTSRDLRMREATKLAVELTQPQSMQAISSALKMAPELQGGLSMSVDVLDQLIQESSKRPEQLRELLGLLVRVSRPEILSKLGAGLDALEQAPDLVGTMLDLADQQVRQWLERNQAQGSSVENVVANAAQLFQWLSLDSTRDFLSKELSDSSSVQALAFLADSVRKATQKPPKAVGLFKGARKLGHTDSQYALGFVCDVVEHLGRSLSQRPVSNRTLVKQEN